MSPSQQRIHCQRRISCLIDFCLDGVCRYPSSSSSLQIQLRIPWICHIQGCRRKLRVGFPALWNKEFICIPLAAEGSRTGTLVLSREGLSSWELLHNFFYDLIEALKCDRIIPQHGESPPAFCSEQAGFPGTRTDLFLENTSCSRTKRWPTKAELGMVPKLLQTQREQEMPQTGEKVTSHTPDPVNL